MKAITTRGNGSVELSELPVPQPGSGEVLVAVRATSVNPVDVGVTDGVFHRVGVISGDGPVGLGWDVAGEVVAVGDGVTTFVPGQRVAGLLPAMGVPSGGLAEYAVLPAADLAAVPEGLDAADAAAVGLNALAAQQAIRLLGEPDGRSLLVTGAAGAFGGFALELLDGSGFEVSGLARETDGAFVTARGAKLVTELDPELDAGAYDVVLDAAALQEAALSAVRPGGTFVGVRPAMPVQASAGRTTTAVGVVPDGAGLRHLLELAASGTLTVRVAGVLPLADAATAIARVRAGGHRGRWILTP